MNPHTRNSHTLNNPKEDGGGVQQGRKWGALELHSSITETRKREQSSEVVWLSEWESERPKNPLMLMLMRAHQFDEWQRVNERERKKAEKEKEEVYKFTPNIQILSFSLSALRLAFALQAGKHKCIK